MNRTLTTPPIVIETEIELARRLIKMLGPANVQMLLDDYCDVIEDPGYGSVELVITDRRLETIKKVTSKRAQRNGDNH